MIGDFLRAFVSRGQLKPCLYRGGKQAVFVLAGVEVNARVVRLQQLEIGKVPLR